MKNIHIPNNFLPVLLRQSRAFAAVALLMLAGVSCKKALVEEPKSLSVTTFYNTAAEVEAATNAIYLPYLAASNDMANYMVLLSHTPIIASEEILT